MAKTSVGISIEAREQLRLAQLDMSAAERRKLDTSEVVTKLIAAWRQIAAAGRPGR
jgi:hypothetical protein